MPAGLRDGDGKGRKVSNHRVQRWRRDCDREGACRIKLGNNRKELNAD